MAKKSKTPGVAMLADGDGDWRARSDLRTIEEAHEIIGDQSRMGALKRHAKKQKAALERIERLKGKHI